MSAHVTKREKVRFGVRAEGSVGELGHGPQENSGGARHARVPHACWETQDVGPKCEDYINLFSSMDIGRVLGLGTRSIRVLIGLFWVVGTGLHSLAGWECFDRRSAAASNEFRQRHKRQAAR